MIEVQPIEFILRALPESFLVIFAIYNFSKTKVDKSKYITTSILFSVIIYITRIIPISYGVHMILSILSLLIIIVFYNNINVIKGIKGIIFIYLIQLVSELINVFILKMMDVDLEVLSTNRVYKNILGLPSLAITGIIILIIYLINRRREKIKKI